MCSIYCGSIITVLLLTSCYWYTPALPTSWSVEWWTHTRVGFGISRLVQWLGSPYSPREDMAAAATVAPHCANCWINVAPSKLFDYFAPTPRRPLCEKNATYPPATLDTPSTSHMFLGIPGTSLGFALDWSVFL